ncbi:hypothetical protein LB553_02940 [Mesorhizobium sp. CA8]|nr:hypothetical protein [Mesorhizobium sp. CA8]MBZ9759838.1 hypothetical protein [Mesorhizobium sp. CA8]
MMIDRRSSIAASLTALLPAGASAAGRPGQVTLFDGGVDQSVRTAMP